MILKFKSPLFHLLVYFNILKIHSKRVLSILSFKAISYRNVNIFKGLGINVLVKKFKTIVCCPISIKPTMNVKLGLDTCILKYYLQTGSMVPLEKKVINFNRPFFYCEFIWFCFVHLHLSVTCVAMM